MLRVNMNENVAVHKAPERQAAVQGQLSTGRVVGQNRATIQKPGQMAGVSSTTFRRAIPPHSEAVHSRAVKRTTDFSSEAVSIERPKRPETTIEPWQFKKQVDDAVRQLCDERDRNEPDHLSFCLRVVDTYKMFIKHLGNMQFQWRHNTYESCRRHVISKMEALYHENLDEILTLFHDQAAAGRAWVYTDKLDKVAQGFNALGRKARNATDNKALLTRIWNMYLNEDLNYLKHLKDSPNNDYSARRTAENIQWLAGDQSPSCILGLISDESRKKIMEQAQSLHQEVTRSDMAHSDAGEKKEDVTHKTTDAMMEKRKHHDRILEQLNKLRSRLKTEGDVVDYHGSVRNCKRIDHLRKLSTLYEEYKKLVDDPDTVLFKGLVDLIAPFVHEERDKLEKGAYDNDRKLKEEVSLLVGNLEEENWFSREYKDPHSGCMQSQSTVIPAEQEHEEFHMRIHQIFAILKNEAATIDDRITALAQIKQLRDDLEGKQRKFPEKKLTRIQQHIQSAENMAYTALFAPILNEYGQNKGHAEMYRHKDEFVKLNPYVFVFNTYDTLKVWQCAASYAWYHDLDRLRHQTFFSENDVDNLLDLKDAAPELPISQIRNHLMTTLTNLFQTMLQTNLSPALIEKVTELSEWIDDIDRRHCNVSPALHEYNKEWREKYVSEGGRAATSYAPAARMPSFVRPGGIPGAFPTDFDCPPPMRLQNVPYMRQFSIPFPCPGVPTPAPFGAFQQSGSSIPCRAPIAQSVAGSRPFPPPWLINRPFLPRIPEPACNRADFRRPPVCGQIRPRWRQAESRQQYEPRRSAMPFEEYRSGYSSSSDTW